jgi:phthiodiolone/phenolphthiodiolone dimycocerosates ketoreductase
VPDIMYGASPVQFPPVEAHRPMLQAYEQAGMDFFAYWDQTCLTIPRSLWTPDLCPAAERFDIDAWFEPWPQMSDAALATERARFGVVCDVLRRPPSVLAQLAMTIDHYSKGRFFLTLGAGEAKQITPYGVSRDKPFGRLEETLKLLRLWFETNEPIDYDGNFWKIEQGGLMLPPYTEGGPEILVAGGPGKALKFAAQLADGWMTYFPGSPPEAYAEEAAEFGRLAEDVGKDPEPMTRLVGIRTVIGESEDHVEEMIQNPILRFDTAAMVPGGHTWKAHGVTNPLGEDFSYPRDLFPMQVSREYALEIAAQVPTEMVRKLSFCGTPDQVAEQVQPFIEAGANHILIVDFGSLISTGDMGDAVAGSNRLVECYNHLRKLNGQPLPTAAAQAAAGASR